MTRQIFFIFVMLWSVTTRANDTELRFYRPFTESSKQQAVTLIEKKSGECEQQSQLIKRDDAWQCVSEGQVYDPCFVDPVGSHLDAFCLATPWSAKETQVTVARPLDNARHEPLDMSNTLPWALELTTGERCQSMVSEKSYEGLPVHYRCDSQTELVGHVQRCDSQWKILQHSSSGTRITSIARAWF